MAWNRPSEREQGIGNREQGARKSPFRGLVAGAVVVLGAGIAAWLLWPTAKHGEDTASTRKGLIREATPSVAPKEKEQTKKSTPAELPPQRLGEVRDGKLMMPDGTLRVVKGEITNDNSRAKNPYQIFKHPSDNILAAMLMAKPGQMAISQPDYNGRFTKSFLASLREQIVVSSDDSDEVKELKRAVNEAKIELKAAYDRGEDIEKIVSDSRKELQRLGQFRNQVLLDTKLMAAKNAESAADVDDYIKAANKMLEERGIAPIDDTPLMRVKLRLLERQEQKGE